LPSGAVLKNGHLYPSEQHRPQLTHEPFRFFETGNIEAKVLFIFLSIFYTPHYLQIITF